jgi:hypothetical protein
MNDNLFRLIDACCEAYDNPAFKPNGGITYCNQAVHFISERLGFSGFKGMMANQMATFLKKSKAWKQIPFQEAQSRANDGQLVIAAVAQNPHGHVAVIRPGLMGMSGKWKMAVPKVVNIGAENFIGKPINWAFRDPPDVFVLEG